MIRVSYTDHYDEEAEAMFDFIVNEKLIGRFGIDFHYEDGVRITNYYINGSPEDKEKYGEQFVEEIVDFYNLILKEDSPKLYLNINLYSPYIKFFCRKGFRSYHVNKFYDFSFEPCGYIDWKSYYAFMEYKGE